VLFFENVWVRYLIAAAFVYLIPKIKGYLQGESSIKEEKPKKKKGLFGLISGHDDADFDEDEDEDEDDEELFEEFKKWRKKYA
jgi:hypothetical protein